MILSYFICEKFVHMCVFLNTKVHNKYQSTHYTTLIYFYLYIQNVYYTKEFIIHTGKRLREEKIGE